MNRLLLRPLLVFIKIGPQRIEIGSRCSLDVPSSLHSFHDVTRLGIGCEASKTRASGVAGFGTALLLQCDVMTRVCETVILSYIMSPKGRCLAGRGGSFFKQ